MGTAVTAVSPVVSKVISITCTEMLSTLVTGSSRGMFRQRLMPSSSYTTGVRTVRQSGSPQMGSVQTSRHLPFLSMPQLTYLFEQHLQLLDLQLGI